MAQPLAVVLVKWSAELPHVTIVLFSRIVGYDHFGEPFAAHAYLRPLNSGQQERLLEKWLGPTAAANVWSRLKRSVGLREACKVPLSLSLIAFLSRSGAHHPIGKRGLYALGLVTLLERGHQNGRCGVTNPSSARFLLGELSLRLQDLTDESWPREVLEDLLRNLADDARQHLHPTWRDAGDFLNEIGEYSGVIAAHDGKRGPWRFFHRQFRELLAAEALQRRGRGALLELARTLSVEDTPRWVEVFGFACEMAPDPLEVLGEMGKANGDLALRVLPELDAVDRMTALTVLASNVKWEGNALLELVTRCNEQDTFEQGQIVGWLWSQIAGHHGVRELAALHYALGQLEGHVESERFFRSCGRWPQEGTPEPRLVDISGGEFLFGSPEGEEGRTDSEGPQRVVQLSPFRLSATAVTNAEYAAFDPAHRFESFGGKLAPSELGDHPVVNISWWEAYLYCAWIGGKLPTEAQWEYACRAGSSTPFSYGFAIHPKLANTDETGLGSTVEVGSLAPNAWGLYEMHGNVWEWCSDWQGPYSSSQDANPVGPKSGAARVIRGGSWTSPEQSVRSATRLGRLAADGGTNLGFRVAGVSRTAK